MTDKTTPEQALELFDKSLCGGGGAAGAAIEDLQSFYNIKNSDVVIIRAALRQAGEVDRKECKCGGSNPYGANFCGMCGYNFDEKVALSQRVGVTEVTVLKFCEALSGLGLTASYAECDSIARVLAVKFPHGIIIKGA